MKLYDLKNKKNIETAEGLRGLSKEGHWLVMCETNEVDALEGIFGFDESTLVECTDLDESVRYSSFDGYDFISLVHLERKDKALILREINLYIAKNYLVLVMPEHKSRCLAELENEITTAAAAVAGEKPNPVNRLCLLIFNKLLSDFSEILEAVEDEIEALSEKIVGNPDENRLTEIFHLRKTAYTAKKQLRSLSYIGEQMLMDENGIIDKEQAKYFRSIDTRFKKLYDFSASLYDLSNGLLSTYDSRLSSKTNDVVTKLTLITLLFSPLMLITGIYGMNFIYMPELAKPYAYPAVLLIMAVIVAGLYIFAKRKKLL